MCCYCSGIRLVDCCTPFVVSVGASCLRLLLDCVALVGTVLTSQAVYFCLHFQLMTTWYWPSIPLLCFRFCFFILHLLSLVSLSPPKFSDFFVSFLTFFYKVFFSPVSLWLIVNISSTPLFYPFGFSLFLL